MNILHGTWIPELEDGFVQKGGFYLWVETDVTRQPQKPASHRHPRHLQQEELATCLKDLGVRLEYRGKSVQGITSQYFLLPTAGEMPLPSPELVTYLEQDLPETFSLQYWQIECFELVTTVKTGSDGYGKACSVIKTLRDVHFLTTLQPDKFQLGSDLWFWYHYTQAFKQIILKDHYIPALKYRSIPTQKPASKKSGKTKSTGVDTEIYPTWEIISERYDTDLHRYVEFMPVACACGFSTSSAQIEYFDRETLLQHFSEYLLNDIVTHTLTTNQFDQAISGTLLELCWHQSAKPLTGSTILERYQQWYRWHQKITRSQKDTPFYLLFQLQEPEDTEEDWQLRFIVQSKQDPSFQLDLEQYWLQNRTQKKQTHQILGSEFEQNLLLQLGYAARIYPQLWQGMETDRPAQVALSLTGAFEFLKESAWILEDAGFKVSIPAWWTPEGLRRTKLKLKASGRSLSGSQAKKSYFSFDSLVNYQYELAIGDEVVSEKEWQQLVQAKIPLIQFRGQWVQLDLEQMQKMLEFWRSHQDDHPLLSLTDLMKLTADVATPEGLSLELDRDEVLAEILDRLNDKSRLEPLPDPPEFQGSLREYQKRGVSWIYYLESLGLNGCLADDMGLGKTVQLIARLVHERINAETVGPTLLIVPTSVIGNWQKEIEKFAPHLRALIHHGSARIQEKSVFKTTCLAHDVVITSFTLARKDEAFFHSLTWQRVVVDEAQNIKNPKAAQTKSICKLLANHRLALTGTPVENRLMDLWSIFNFLNPDYLGKETHFRKSFELPIQRDNDLAKATVLKKLVEPLILRRVKTDQSIIKDLPDKIEQKLYCNLTKEQASLYEAVVKDVEEKLESSEGIQRKGLILSTLMKLKQICNHPMQFLHDGSEFSGDRSHKLSRLLEMTTEVIEEEERLLVFTQFTEIGAALESYFRHHCRYTTYYLHGGTSRTRRERMIAEFQDPEIGPAVFVLSLKAGGVGITLTQANHVFHFDRWWNPAVEDQATDRAFRIGQRKNVFVHKFVTIGTLEERIDQMIEDKKRLSQSIVGADESWLTELDNESFKKLISLNKQAILE